MPKRKKSFSLPKKRSYHYGAVAIFVALVCSLMYLTGWPFGNGVTPPTQQRGTLQICATSQGNYVSVLVNVYGPETRSGTTSASNDPFNFLKWEVLVGQYTVSGTYNNIYKDTSVQVSYGEVSTAILNFGTIIPPDTWIVQEYSSNPVLSNDQTYDGGTARNVRVYKFDGLYYMLYTGASTVSPYSWTICMAYSSDKNTWTKLGRIIDISPSGFDRGGVDVPCIIKEGNTYYLYYLGESQVAPDGTPRLVPGSYRVGLATSQNIRGPYTKYGANPVLWGNVGDWDEYLESPEVLRYNSTHWIMYYTGVSVSRYQWTIGAAFSTDLYTWQKYSGNPLPNYFGYRAEDSHVVAVGSTYYMLVNQIIDRPPNGLWADTVYMYENTTSDLLHWSFKQVLISPPHNAGWDSLIIGSPAVIYENGQLIVFFDGGTTYTHYNRRIGYAICTG